MNCPKCGADCAEGLKKCFYCGAELRKPEPASPLRPAPAPAAAQPSFSFAQPTAPSTDPAAVWALVCGLVSFFLVGIVLGIVAIVLGATSRQRIDRSNGWLRGRGMATAGIVLGILGLIVSVVWIIAATASS